MLTQLSETPLPRAATWSLPTGLRTLYCVSCLSLVSARCAGNLRGQASALTLRFVHRFSSSYLACFCLLAQLRRTCLLSECALDGLSLYCALQPVFILFRALKPGAPLLPLSDVKSPCFHRRQHLYQQPCDLSSARTTKDMLPVVITTQTPVSVVLRRQMA